MPSPQSRRRFLLASGTLLAATSGCLSDTGGRTPTETDTETPTPTRSRTDQSSEPTPAVDTVWVTDSVVHVANVDSLVVAGAPDGERLVLATYVDESRIDPEAFDLVVDGKSFVPQPPPGTYTDFETIARSSDRVADGQALVGFVVPVQDAVERVSLTYGEGWTRDLRASTRDRLTVEPAFEVREFSLPDIAEPDAPIPATLTVANVGAGVGVFRAVAPAWGMLPTVIERELAAGESTTFETEVGEQYSGGLTGASAGETREVTLSWAGGETTATVRFEERQSTTSVT
ncbi:hypothetical protein ACFQJ5_07970 [Halomicroarcula sp. GCM10025324]|uniref:hypothetical protein n=1 Tax=Haloarcula TaxID=2237 RepID=UPI0023E7E474|nr:hypothetical protein [Halomicroarcula sp. ZS-22-S1]